MRIPLRLQPVLIALTLLNLGILGVIIAREQAVAAPALTSDGILRGRGLQIVDDQGKVRASITINPAVKQPDGSTYLETVLLRMITSEGRPVVKISSSRGWGRHGAVSGRGARLCANSGARQRSKTRRRRWRRQRDFETAVGVLLASLGTSIAMLARHHNGASRGRSRRREGVGMARAIARSRPHRLHRPTPDRSGRRGRGFAPPALHRQGRSPSRLGVSPATVSRILRRLGLNKLTALEPAEPVRRYEREQPGEMIHLDIKKLGRFKRIGHRITGDRQGPELLPRRRLGVPPRLHR